MLTRLRWALRTQLPPRRTQLRLAASNTLRTVAPPEIILLLAETLFQVTSASPFLSDGLTMLLRCALNLAVAALCCFLIDCVPNLRIDRQCLSCALVGSEALCSITFIRVWLKVLGKTFVMVLLCHSSECGWI